MNNKKLIKFALQVGTLKNIKRHGWILKGIKNVESVADHIFRVALMTMIFSAVTKLDVNKMIKMALIHDIGEALVGDVIYEHGKKRIGPLKVKNADERNAVKEIFRDVAKKGEYVSLWEEFVAQDTQEARFVKRIEKLEMVIQALEYQKYGYDSNLFDEFWENARKYIKGTDLENILQELEIKRGELT